MNANVLTTDDVSISFVIPLHNEEKSLLELQQKIVAVCQENKYYYEIIFVDDGSSDNSFNILEDIAKKNMHCIVIQLKRNFGQAAALSAGIDEASHSYIITLDADLQNDPADAPLLLNKLQEGFDVVSGWRKKRKDNFLRRLPSQCANNIISRLTGVRLSDYGCTLKIYRREYLKNTPLYGDMHRFIPVFTAWQGAKVTEIPIRHHPRRHGKSHYGVVNRTGRVLLDLLTVKFLHTFLTRPMHFFGSAGFILLALGGTAGIAAIILKVTEIRALVDTPLPLAAVFFVIIGGQSLLLGLLAELIIRTYFEQPDRHPYRVRNVVRSDKKS